MSPKVSTKSHHLRMSMRSRPFWNIVSTRCHCPRNVSIPPKMYRINTKELVCFAHESFKKKSKVGCFCIFFRNFTTALFLLALSVQEQQNYWLWYFSLNTQRLAKILYTFKKWSKFYGSYGRTRSMVLSMSNDLQMCA